MSRLFRTAPALILLLLALHLAIGLGLCCLMLAGRSDAVYPYLRIVGGIFLIFCAAVELSFALFAWSGFTADQPMWLAWAFVSASSACRLTGYCLSNQFAAATPFMRDIGIMLSSPFALFLLTIAFSLVLFEYRALGWSSPLRFRDYAALAVVVAFTARQAWEVWRFQRGIPSSPIAAINWATDPLLCALLLLALLLWRTTRSIDGGLVTYCWLTYAAAAMLTFFGNVGLWVTNWYFVPWPWNSIAWFVWYPAAAAFAAAPAFQFEAVRRLALLPARLKQAC